MSFYRAKTVSPAKKKILIAASAFVLVAATVFGLMGFLKPSDAAGSIEIDYSGGTRLVNDVTFDANKINSMIDLLGDNTRITNIVGAWQDGYIDSGGGKFLPIPAGEKDWSNTYWTTSGKYIDIKVTLVKTLNKYGTDSTQSSGIALFADSRGRSVDSGRDVYDENGTEIFHSLLNSDPTYPGVFYQFHVDVYKTGTQEKVDVPRIYFKIGDIDVAQSYKILSEPLNNTNMYAKSDPPFDTNTGESAADLAQHNYFNESTGAIYSSYCTQYTNPVCEEGKVYGVFRSDATANVYAKLSKVHSEGVDFVYGFHTKAGSNLGFSTEQYTVSYSATTGGTVSNESEEVFADNKAKEGSTPTPNEGYSFTYWTADQDVILPDGTRIAKDQLITMDQIKQIVVTKNISFTAHFESLPKLSITKSADKTEYKVGDTINYVLTVSQIVEDAEARNVVVTDQLSEANISKYDADSFKVLLNNNDVTSQTDITVRENDFEIKTHQNISKNDTIVVKYSAQALNPIKKLVNTAKATCENSEAEAVAETKFTIRIVAIPKLSITKSADKTEYKVGDTINYVLTVNQIVEDAEAQNVVITDQLSNANIIKYDKNSFKVFLNNSDITSQADITVRENDFEIKTHQNIGKDDTIVVKYSAKALNPIEKLINTAKASCENSEAEAVAETKFTIRIVADAPNTGLMANDPEDASAETDINFNLIIAGAVVAIFFTVIYVCRRIRNKVRFN